MMNPYTKAEDENSSNSSNGITFVDEKTGQNNETQPELQTAARDDCACAFKAEKGYMSSLLSCFSSRGKEIPLRHGFMAFQIFNILGFALIDVGSIFFDLAPAARLEEPDSPEALRWERVMSKIALLHHLKWLKLILFMYWGFNAARLRQFCLLKLFLRIRIFIASFDALLFLVEHVVCGLVLGSYHASALYLVWFFVWILFLTWELRVGYSLIRVLIEGGTGDEKMSVVTSTDEIRGGTIQVNPHQREEIV